MQHFQQVWCENLVPCTGYLQATLLIHESVLTHPPSLALFALLQVRIVSFVPESATDLLNAYQQLLSWQLYLRDRENSLQHAL